MSKKPKGERPFPSEPVVFDETGQEEAPVGEGMDTEARESLEADERAVGDAGNVRSPEARGFTGHAVTLDWAPGNLTRVIMLEMKDGRVTDHSVVSDPDAPAITMSKAEGMLWRVFHLLREGQ